MPIKIYNDIGVSKESAQHCLYSLKLYAPKNYSVAYISAKEIVEGHGLATARLLVLPGGRDLYYVQSLQGKGNQQIQDYLSRGGCFLGICAGSYYSGTYLEFAKATAIEVVGPRALGLFQGIVKGPVWGPYYYGSDKGARTAQLTLHYNRNIKDCYVFYNGGGYFVEAKKMDNIEIIASYQNGEAAIIQCHYGLGNAILSGVHLEYDPSIIKKKSLHNILAILYQTNNQRIKLFNHLLEMLAIR